MKTNSFVSQAPVGYGVCDDRSTGGYAYQTGGDGNLLTPAGNNAPVMRSAPAMTEPWCSEILPPDIERIKRAVEGTCELCHEYIPLPLLELHGIPSGTEILQPQPKERERNILVVCSTCHRHIHELPVPEEKLRARIEKRPFAVRKEILCALHYVPKRYSLPEDTDLARVYDETLRNSSAGYYR